MGFCSFLQRKLQKGFAFLKVVTVKKGWGVQKLSLVLAIAIVLPESNVLEVAVTDESDGCGAKFSAVIVSSKFEGKPLLQRHRMVNSILEEELKVIHAFSQQTLTPQQWEEKKS